MTPDLEQALSKTKALYERMRAETATSLDDLRNGRVTCTGPDGSDQTARFAVMQEALMAQTENMLAKLRSEGVG